MCQPTIRKTPTAKEQPVELILAFGHQNVLRLFVCQRAGDESFMSDFGACLFVGCKALGFCGGYVGFCDRDQSVNRGTNVIRNGIDGLFNSVDEAGIG